MYFSKKARALLAVVPLTLLLSQHAFAASYTVTSGDSLYQVAKLFNTSISTIKQDNNLTSDVIYPGQSLYVASATYTVKSGDSLYLIALRNGISLNSLRAANNKWDNSIYPGQKLILPGQGTNSSQPAQNTTTATNSGAVFSYTSEDLDLLARLITAEAEGQPYEAKVAVGAVVINRVQDSRFPKSIKDVIYQIDNGYYQFTPVKNGMIYKPASQDAIKAAYAALHGSDPTNGAVYYFDDSTTNKWLWSKPLALRVDRMVFTY